MDKEQVLKKVDIDLAEDEIEITEENFNEYFFDVRRHSPQKDQIIACYSAVAYFEEGPEKRQMIQLVKDTQKAEAASQVMRKLLFASEPDCWRVPREIAMDLLSGMSEAEVEKKSYKYIVQMYYYTKPHYVPEDDPHWTTISLLNLDQFLSKRYDSEVEIDGEEHEIKDDQEDDQKSKDGEEDQSSLWRISH